jgi:Ion transport protein
MNTVQRISTSISPSQFLFDTSTSTHLFAISSLFESLQTLFWGTFGLIDLQTFQIYKKHTFTMFIGLLMFGVYSSIMIIVLLNMLIAMMSNSYQYIAVSNLTVHGLKDVIRSM